MVLCQYPGTFLSDPRLDAAPFQPLPGIYFFDAYKISFDDKLRKRCLLAIHACQVPLTCLTLRTHFGYEVEVASRIKTGVMPCEQIQPDATRSPPLGP